MDTAFLVTDYAERGARFLKELAASPHGPARAAYWKRADVGWDDEPGDWQFTVLPGGDAPRGRAARIGLAKVAVGMSCPQLGMYAPGVPWEDDPLPAALEAYDLCGFDPRWVGEAELPGVSGISGGGVFAYPPAALGHRPVESARTTSESLAVQSEPRRRRRIRTCPPRSATDSPGPHG